MVKVISFSLWGKKEIYLIGSIRNAHLAQKYYPDYECWFYIHKDTVPIHIINKLNTIHNVKIILRTGNLQKARMWRYEPIDNPDVEILLSRDTDSRLSVREVSAVNEWLKTDKLFHIMRDHPHHNFPIMAGMFGTKKINNFNWGNIIDEYKPKDTYFYDQNFLTEKIYPLILNNSVIHATFNKFESHAIQFPTPYNDNYNFVGEYIYPNGTQEKKDVDKLKKALII